MRIFRNSLKTINRDVHSLLMLTTLFQRCTADTDSKVHVTFSIPTLLPTAMSGERAKGTRTITKDLQCTNNLRKGTVIFI
jgi:hypothetical protein